MRLEFPWRLSRKASHFLSQPKGIYHRHTLKGCRRVNTLLNGSESRNGKIAVVDANQIWFDDLTFALRHPPSPPNPLTPLPAAVVRTPWIILRNRAPADSEK